jgi:hypothetical protein
MLRVELAALEDDGFNLDLVGFSDDEIEDLLRESETETAGKTDDDAVPETQEAAVTAPGDVWILGNHRLLCGDATIAADVEKVLAGSLADMAFTDPPYNVNYGATMKDKFRGNKRRIANDALGGGFTNRSSTGGRNGRTTSGAVRATKTTFGSPVPTTPKRS